MSYADKYGHLLETGTPVRTSDGDYGVVSSLFMKNNAPWATVQGPYMTGTKHEFPTRKIWKQGTDVGAEEGGSSRTLSELVNDWKGRQILHGGTWKEIGSAWGNQPERCLPNHGALVLSRGRGRHL